MTLILEPTRIPKAEQSPRRLPVNSDFGYQRQLVDCELIESRGWLDAGIHKINNNKNYSYLDINTSLYLDQQALDFFRRSTRIGFRNSAPSGVAQRWNAAWMRRWSSVSILWSVCVTFGVWFSKSENPEMCRCIENICLTASKLFGHGPQHRIESCLAYRFFRRETAS